MKSPPTSDCPTHSLSLTTRLPKRGGKKSTVAEIKEVGDNDNDDVSVVKKKGNFIKTILIPLGKTYGVLADRVYEQPLPADEIAHMCRHMQTLNLHPDPKGAGDHEPTSAPIFPYGPVNGRDSSSTVALGRMRMRMTVKKMARSHWCVTGCVDIGRGDAGLAVTTSVITVDL
ncbi:uncharacterized protein G2W53_022331 [Senna tora]|uniref:Uncharacterized protein n=1 Tax=Senna tora TaxID=362788 RepID=A0A834TLK2_9FABA|nr:uncharacterized protein G2W53_022331 [Senna tora]